MTAQISQAESSDLGQLAGLLDALFSQETEFAPDRETQMTALRSIINDPRIGEITVARKDGRCVGMVLILYTISTALGARVALLEDMIVAENCRGEGVGRQLINAAMERARRSGCKRVSLLTDADNLSAQRFYRSRGFSRSSMAVMRMYFENDEQ
ncbi:MAG: GNAT family N-acetyltransferase [Pseudomonadota bacterium]